jgi:hypothetical protein
MGELIAFKPTSGGTRVRAVPNSGSTVIVFAGLWQERPKDNDSEPKRTRRSSRKRSRQSVGEPSGSDK